MKKQHTLNMATVRTVVAVMALSIFTCFSIVACSDDDDDKGVVPDNWVSIDTTPLSIGYEGGQLSLDYQLAAGVDAGVPYVVNQEEWCSGYIKDGKILIDVEVSENVHGRSASMALIYDSSHSVTLTVQQGVAPVVPVTGIDDSNIPETININDQLDLTSVVSVLPTNASFKELTFELLTGSEFVELLDDGCTIRGLDPGTATLLVKATSDDEQVGMGLTKEITVKVKGDIVYDRTNWTATGNQTYSNGKDYVYDTKADTGYPNDMFDGNKDTFFSMVKPGKTYSDGGVSYAPSSTSLTFTIDLHDNLTFNYFQWLHRNNGNKDFLQVLSVNIYASNDGNSFTKINTDALALEANNFNLQTIEIPETTCRYVKVEYLTYSSGGSTAQCSEFGLGRLIE